MLLYGIIYRDRSLEIMVSQIPYILPVSKPFTTTIDIQISYFSGVKLNPIF